MNTPNCTKILRAALAALAICTLAATPALATTGTAVLRPACTQSSARPTLAAATKHSSDTTVSQLSETRMLLFPVGVLACAGIIIVARLKQKDPDGDPSRMAL